MTHPLALTDREIARLDSRQLAEYEELLADQAAKVGRTAWRRRARPEQLPPEGPWSTLFLRGGRGSGKSWSGAHILAELITSDVGDEGPGQWAVIAPTYGDARDTCIESPESGLLAALGTSFAEVSSGRSRLVALYNRSLGELRLTNGAVLFIDGADDGALRIQGKNLRGAWADEIGLWRRWEQAWDESIAYALRKGDARLVATGTPKSDMPARQLVRRLINDEAVVVRRLRTFDNVEHLSPAFIAAAERRAGTRLGRQELEGELLEDVEGALWQRSWIDDNRVSHACPAGWRALVVGLDPSDGSGGGAQQGLVAAGLGMDHRLYVVHSEGMRVSPLAYCERAVRLASDLGASRLVVEKNFGGGYLLEVLEQAMRKLGRRVAVQVVTATQGKHTRAEPVASLYEQNEVHHVGEHAELEEQLVCWTGAPGERSPDLLDSLVHAMTELMGYGRSGATDMGRAVPYTDDPRVRVEGGAVPWEGSEYGSGRQEEAQVLYVPARG